MESKAWYLSKTLWVNAIALIAMVLQGVFNKEIGCSSALLSTH